MLSKEIFVETEIVSMFIEFMAKIISGDITFEHNYFDRKRRKKILYTTLESAFNDYYWAGKNYTINEKLLKGHQSKLRSMNGESFNDEVNSVFIWGKVQACWKWVEKQPKPFNLKGSVEDAVSVMHSSRPDLENFGPNGAYRMNSGFTKIYALFSDDIIIYDGRVGAALGYLVTLFMDEEELKVLPEQLKFAWKNGQSAANRNPSITDKNWNFPMMVPHNDKLHAMCNIHTNWILEAALKRNGYSFSGKHGQDALRAVESALFMLGYDFPERSKGPRSTKTESTRDKIHKIAIEFYDQKANQFSPLDLFKFSNKTFKIESIRSALGSDKIRYKKIEKGIYTIKSIN